jgi:predicted acetyltransferase
MMAELLQIKFLAEEQLSEEIKKQINDLDHEAFSTVDQDKDEEFAKIEWASNEWMALGFVNDQLVTQLCLLKRKINVGEGSIIVAGIGGVATTTQWLKQGFSSMLLQSAADFMRNEMKVPFGLLICDDKVQQFYTKNGWQKIAESLWFTQENQRHPLKSCVMIIPLANQKWPMGEIDLNGLPW